LDFVTFLHVLLLRSHYNLNKVQSCSIKLLCGMWIIKTICPYWKTQEKWVSSWKIHCHVSTYITVRWDGQLIVSIFTGICRQAGKSNSLSTYCNDSGPQEPANKMLEHLWLCLLALKLGTKVKGTCIDVSRKFSWIQRELPEWLAKKLQNLQFPLKFGICRLWCQHKQSKTKKYVLKFTTSAWASAGGQNGHYPPMEIRTKNKKIKKNWGQKLNSDYLV